MARLARVSAPRSSFTRWSRTICARRSSTCGTTRSSPSPMSRPPRHRTAPRRRSAAQRRSGRATSTRSWCARASRGLLPPTLATTRRHTFAIWTGACAVRSVSAAGGAGGGRKRRAQADDSALHLHRAAMRQGHAGRPARRPLFRAALLPPFALLRARVDICSASRPRERRGQSGLVRVGSRICTISRRSFSARYTSCRPSLQSAPASCARGASLPRLRPPSPA